MGIIVDKLFIPLGLGILLLWIEVILKLAERRRAAMVFLTFSILELLVFSAPLISRLLLNTLANTNSHHFASSADVAILRGGMMRGQTDRPPDLTDAADRA